MEKHGQKHINIKCQLTVQEQINGWLKQGVSVEDLALQFNIPIVTAEVVKEIWSKDARLTRRLLNMKEGNLFTFENKEYIFKSLTFLG